jgi:hypothetical protein
MKAVILIHNLFTAQRAEAACICDSILTGHHILRDVTVAIGTKTEVMFLVAMP